MEYSYKFRLYPNRKQENLILRTFGCCRFVFNHYLAQRMAMMRARRKKENLTMLDALQRLWNHRTKRKDICFEITIDGASRKVFFGKFWSRIKGWLYFVQDGEYSNQYVYSEQQIVSAIMSVLGTDIYKTQYHINQR